MKHWIITDTHLGHHNMWKHFGRPRNFEELIINNLLNVLNPEDVLICLGDVALNGGQHNWHQTLNRLSICKKVLIVGNHDKHSLEWLQDKWDFVAHQIMIQRYGFNIVFSHKPVIITEDEINIHGHFHDIPLEKCFECEPELKELYTNRHILLAMEPHYKPFNLESIIKQYRKKL